MIEVNNLSKKYGDVFAVENVSFDIKKGEIIGLLGPNGAGKSTIMRILTGFLPASSGTARVGGFSVENDNLEVRKRVGFLPENNPLYDDMTVYEYLKFAADMQGVSADSFPKSLGEVLQVCGLKDRVHMPISQLSKGYRQRVGLAQAFIAQPDVLILDEPTTGLDPNQIVEIREVIKHLGRERTVILSSHILSEVEATCSRVLILNKGKIVAEGEPALLRRAMVSGMQIIVEYNEASNKLLRSFCESRTDITDFRPEPSDKNGLYTVTITTNWENDKRHMLLKEMMNAGIQVTSFSDVRMRLEDVFHSLTQ